MVIRTNLMAANCWCHVELPIINNGKNEIKNNSKKKEKKNINTIINKKQLIIFLSVHFKNTNKIVHVLIVIVDSSFGKGHFSQESFVTFKCSFESFNINNNLLLITISFDFQLGIYIAVGSTYVSKEGSCKILFFEFWLILCAQVYKNLFQI